MIIATEGSLFMNSNWLVYSAIYYMPNAGRTEEVGGMGIYRV